MTAQPIATTNTPTISWRKWLNAQGITDTAIAEFGIVPIEDSGIPYRDNYASVAVAYPCVTTKFEVVMRVRQIPEANDPNNKYCKRHLKESAPSKKDEQGDLLLYSWGSGKLAAAIKAAKGVLNLFESPKNAWVHFALTGDKNVSALFGTGNGKLLPTDALTAMGVTKVNYYPDHDAPGYSAAYSVAERCRTAGIACTVYTLENHAAKRGGFDTADLALELGLSVEKYNQVMASLQPMSPDDLALYAPPPAPPARLPSDKYDDSLWDSYVADVERALVRRDGKYAQWKAGATAKGVCPCGQHKHGETNPNGRISERSGYKVFLCDVQGSLDWRDVGSALGVSWDAFKADHNYHAQQDKILDDFGIKRQFEKAPLNIVTLPSNNTADKQEGGENISANPSTPVTTAKSENAEKAPLNAKSTAAPAPVKNDTSVVFQKPPMYDRALEENLIGNVLREPRWWLKLKSVLSPRSFGTQEAQVVWGIMERLDRAVTYATVVAELNRTGLMPSVTEAWLKRVYDGACALEQTEALAERVADFENQRTVYATGERLRDIALNVHIDREGRDGRVRDAVGDLIAPARRKQQTSREIAVEMFDMMEAMLFDPTRLRGLSTGWAGVDAITNGWRDDSYVVFAAPTSGGKSSAMFNSAAHTLIKARKANGAQHRVYICSREMSKVSVLQALFQTIMPINYHQLRRGDISKDHAKVAAFWEEVVLKYGEFGRYIDYLHLSDVSTCSAIRNDIDQIALDTGELPSLIITDYLQRMNADKPTASAVTNLESISKGLKDINMDYRIPVLTATQYHRGASGEGLEGSKGASQIEQDADIYINIKSELGSTPEGRRQYAVWDDVRFLVDKNRGGTLGEVEMEFFRNTTTFVERGRA